MTKSASCLCGGVLLLLLATETPAFACSCARVFTFDQETQSMPVVVVGRVTRVGERPPEEPMVNNVLTVRPFIGAGVTLEVTSVAKGSVTEREIHVWDLSVGTCSNALFGLKVGTYVVAALSRVADSSLENRATWGALSVLPESHFMASGACGEPLRVLNAEQFAQWTGRKLP